MGDIGWGPRRSWVRAGALGVLGLATSFGLSDCQIVNPPKIMAVLMENQNCSDVIGQSDQTFTNALANSYALATQSYAVGHPSLPNYIDLISGQDPANSADDGPPSAHTYSFPTLADQLHTAGVSAKAYAENLPADPTNDAGEYAVRRFPWEYFPGSTSMPIADASALTSDLNGRAPRLRVVHPEPHQRRA
jgi:phosphatidylinositol-3-phosphatase